MLKVLPPQVTCYELSVTWRQKKKEVFFLILRLSFSLPVLRVAKHINDMQIPRNPALHVINITHQLTEMSHFKKSLFLGTSLMVQWSRIHLLITGTWVRSPAGNREHATGKPESPSTTTREAMPQ